jgi:predicted RNase H-like nuclease
MRVAGVDGARGGWVVATLDTGDGSLGIELVERIATVVDRVRRGALHVAGVDMPIGLPDAGPRACDVDARARLGPRRSSVFPAPVRAVLGERDHAAACARARAVDGRGLSVQTFHLLPRIREVDAVMVPDLDRVVLECHPESVFASLAGAPLATTKRTAAGRAERRRLLGAVLPVASEVPARPAGGGAAGHDVLDAVAAAIGAWRFASGDALVLGDGARDGRGLRMAIVA